MWWPDRRIHQNALAQLSINVGILFAKSMGLLETFIFQGSYRLLLALRTRRFEVDIPQTTESRAWNGSKHLSKLLRSSNEIRFLPSVTYFFAQSYSRRVY